ncbi:11453_t:CDS:1 [Ambispora leptoticha]|uniref:Vacuolar membrane-associated protein IML1 n=1 Tax=Ambispora leptoticha TaxID=144679 RepID=A0A9N8V5U0_9GLOM|nr:11453_t:CDS:1 [Ambispora leptoticha]
MESSVHSSAPGVYTKVLNLWVYDNEFAKHDVILNPDCVPGVKPGQLLALFHPNSAEDKSKHLILQVASTDTLDSAFLNKNPALQVAVTKQIAALFGFSGYMGRKEVIARAVDVNSVAAEFIELTFRDQYIGRSDMWRLSTSLCGSWVYVGRKIEFACIRAQVKRIYVKGELVCGGYITDETKSIYRSESAKYFIFIQMSREMWEFDEDGELFFEKAIDGFLPEFFQRWKEVGTNHIGSIVLFSRIFYDYDEDLVNESAVKQDEKGRWYKDFYKVIVDWEAHTDWTSTIVPLKEEFLKYPQDILLRKKNGYESLSGRNSFAFEGNILEAINLALNPFDKHYVDRDLLRTGLAIIVVTPGCGRFEVNKKLLRMTTERMIDNGIGLDLVCLSRIPLHTVPLFRFNSLDPAKAPLPDWWMSKTAGSGGGGSKSQIKDLKPELRDPLDYDEDIKDATTSFYKTPDWIDCSFYTRHKDKPYKPDKFVTRCKMYEIQMMGIMEHEISSILIPYLDENQAEFDSSESSLTRSEENSNSIIDYESYDENIFSNETQKSTIKTRHYLLREDQNALMNGESDRSSEYSYSRRSHDDLIPVSSNKHVELSRSLPKIITPGLIMSPIHPDPTMKSTFYTARPRRVSGSTSDDGFSGRSIQKHNHSNHNSAINTRSNSFEEEQQKIVASSNVIIDNISKSDTQLSRDIIYQESMGHKNRNVTYGEDEYIPESTSMTKPISIKSSTCHPVRNAHRDSSPSPKNSSYSSEIGRYFVRPASKQHYKATLVNPCNPGKTSLSRPGLASHMRRWEHVFPRKIARSIMKWNSLCTPACLPLTTDFFPPINEQGAYNEYTYTISVDPEGLTIAQDDTISEQRKTEILLKEMILQRLSQGYQLIIPNTSGNDDEDDNAANMSNFGVTAKYMSETTKSLVWKEQQPKPNSFSASIPCYLSMGYQVHILTYDPSGQNVEVKRYLRKTQYSSDPIPYQCVIWPKAQEKFELRSVTFRYPNSDYNWNYVDQLVSGYQDVLLEALKFWRTRFILIPMEILPSNAMTPFNEPLNEEEIRVNGIYSFMEIFQDAVWSTPNELPESAQKKKNIKQNLILTTLDPSVYLRASDDIAPRRWSTHPSDERLTRESKLTTIAQAMLHSSTGVVRERRWHLRLYENAIVGNEFVDWLIKNFSDIDTRETAIEFGNDLQNRGLFDHCTKRHRFLDGFYYYQLKKEYAPQRNSRSWFGNQKNNNKDPEKNESSSIKPSTEENIQPSPPKKTLFELSKTITIDVDSKKKSERNETATLHYDVLYNPDNCYHFQLNWLGCTARLLDDMLQSWGRSAAKSGLKLVEAPVEQAMSLTDNNSFQSPTIIKLALQPPSLDAIGKKLHPAINPYLYFEIQLVKFFKFILDVEADDLFPKDVKPIYSYHKTPYKYSQYIHRSGVAFIQIREPGEGYLWVNNRLAITQSSDRLNERTTQAKPSSDPDALMREFQKFCEDEEELKKFWEETASKLPSIVESVEETSSEAMTDSVQPTQIDEKLEFLTLN